MVAMMVCCVSSYIDTNDNNNNGGDSKQLAIDAVQVDEYKQMGDSQQSIHIYTTCYIAYAHTCKCTHPFVSICCSICGVCYICNVSMYM